ncbi:MAG: hypothetical protein ABI643_02710 [Candidatus Doudnabacteria bacterium]
MRPLIGEQHQKYLSASIATFGALLGFEAVSYITGIYQLKIAVLLSFYVYAFHIFWLTFIFDLHLKKRGVLAEASVNFKGAKMVWEAFKERFSHIRRWEYLRHYQNYLVLPGLIYWSTVVLILLNPFNITIKQFMVVSSTIALAVAYWFMKEQISRRMEVLHHWIRLLSVVKLFTAFLIYSAIVGVTIHFGYDAFFLFTAASSVTFLLIYQALFQHNLLNFSIFIWIVIIALAMGLVSLWVYSFWNYEYFTAGLVMLAVYNMFWGLLHNHLDKTLSRVVVFEYLAMMALLITILLATHNFNQRVI